VASTSTGALSLCGSNAYEMREDEWKKLPGPIGRKKLPLENVSLACDGLGQEPWIMNRDSKTSPALSSLAPRTPARKWQEKVWKAAKVSLGLGAVCSRS